MSKMILAIETSSPRAGLALWDQANKELVCEETFSTNRAHNSVILGFAEKMLEICDRKLEGIAVGLGPGSYSGVRVGIALANGLSLSMGVEALGVSSLLAYRPTDSAPSNYAVVGDARRKTRFIAQVIDGRLRGDVKLIPEEEFPQHLNQVRRKGELTDFFSPDKNVAGDFEFVELTQPNATVIGRIAGEQFLNRGDIDRDNPDIRLEPHYLRPPYITTPKKQTAN